MNVAVEGPAGRPLRGGRGLKLLHRLITLNLGGRPLRGGRGLKHALCLGRSNLDKVAPYAGGAD